VNTRSAASLVFIIAATACTSQPNEKTPPVDTTAAVAVTAATAGAPRGLIGAPTLDRDSTKAYFATLHFDKSTKADRDSSYFDSTATVVLLTVPERKAWKVDWPVAFVNRDNEGWFVAQIINQDTAYYKPLDLKPGESVYQWVGPIDSTGSDRAVAYYKVNPSTGEATGPISPMRSVTYCTNPDWRKRSKSAAKKNDPYHSACDTKAYAGKKALVPFYPPDGTWISCVGGCCQVQSPDLTAKTKSTKGN
jgi:hypothetical protein